MSKVKNVAFIDLGTNSVRLDIYQIGSRRKVQRLRRKKEMVRLGEGVFLRGSLEPRAKKRTWSALANFRSLCDHLDVEEVYGVATSALRTATDGKDFAKKLQTEFDFRIDVISGKEEAKLILEGILSEPSFADERFLFIDIGGGSTEIGVCEKGAIKSLESVQLGAARLRQAFLSETVTEAAIVALRKHVRTVLAETQGVAPHREAIRALGCSGSIKAIRKLLRERGEKEQISLAALSHLNREISLLPANELLEVPGMNPRRADLIVPGSLLLEEVMYYLEIDEIEHTAFALRDGLLHRHLTSLAE